MVPSTGKKVPHQRLGFRVDMKASDGWTSLASTLGCQHHQAFREEGSLAASALQSDRVTRGSPPAPPWSP